MSSTHRARLAARLAGAVMLGAATLLIPKADPGEHWATPPHIEPAVEVEQAPDPGDPLSPGPRRAQEAIPDRLQDHRALDRHRTAGRDII